MYFNFLVRHKRDNLPGFLTITYEDNSEIKTVFLLRIINTLATSSTPVYSTKYDPLYIYPRQFHCNTIPMKYYLLPYVCIILIMKKQKKIIKLIDSFHV